MERAFWLSCIPVRLCVGALALFLTLGHRDIAFYTVGVIAGVVATGFAVKGYLSHTHGAFGGRVWWKRARLVHSMLWMLCAVLCFVRVRGAGALLLLDAAMGSVFGVLHFRYGLDL